MKVGIFARTYASKDTGRLFAQVRRDGYTTVQFNLSCVGLAPLPLRLPHGIGRIVAGAAQANGIELHALSGTYNMAHPDARHRKADRARFAHVLAAAREMGAGVVTLCTGSRDVDDMWRAHPENGSAAAWSALRSELELVLPMAVDAGIALAIEPEPGNVIANAPLARRLLDQLGSKQLGIVLDAANLLPPEVIGRQDDIVAEATDLLGDDLLLIHAKDVTANGQVVPAGKGAVDLLTFIARVRRTGFKGPLIGHGFDEVDAPAVAAYLSAMIADTNP